MDKNLENRIDEILNRGVAEVIDRANLKKKLLSGKKLRIKLGIDPTSPNLHLGRAVSLLKLRDLQDLGHQIILLIGDFTGVIGDTSDKESERPMLQAEAVKENMRSYREQAGKILDMEKVEYYYNSTGLSKLGYAEIGEQADQFSLAEFIARENIRKRLDAGTRISLRELLYPLMQGYDSVALQADLELGGTDQRFNLLAGRTLQKKYGQDPQDIIMVNLIEGTDGRKMSSSWGNTINLLDDANSMFGKVMSMGDGLIVKYLIHCTRVPMEEVRGIERDLSAGKINPRDAKLELAREIVKIYHSEAEAEKAKEYFVRTISNKEIPEEVKEIEIDKDEIKLVEFLVLAGLAKSNGEARRKIEQGGLEINGERESDWQRVLKKDEDGAVFKVGKFGFAKIKFE
ncbi:MAG: tyrosine--tRNA ligase [Candidatus Moranbacteria bacterium]|nr:tyrosine--tRNA ligase [bacterium]MDP1833682.1 tyrosine--tRNA ligase [Candidatus Moranbacteria bacterium]